MRALWWSAALMIGVASPARTQSPSRSIDFSTDEGTWLSVDVAPAGDRLVFELLGDLYTLPVAGGQAKPILTGVAFESEPRFSPNGEMIAYVSDRSGSDNIWIARPDGSEARQVSRFTRYGVTAPTWTADGKAIIATVAGASVPRTVELWQIEVATGAGSRIVENGSGPPPLLVSSPQTGPYGAAVSADGKWLYYAAVTPRPWASRDGPRTRLVRRDLATGREESVSVEAPNPSKPAISPNGQLLAYAGFREGRIGLKIRRLSDGNERWLLHPLDPDDLEASASRDIIPHYAFTPDSRAIVLGTGGKLQRVSIEDGRREVIPFSADVKLAARPTLRFPRRLEEGPVRARFLQQPAWSSDGRVAFSALARLYVIDRAGAVPRRLTTDPRPREFAPTWSPDGKWIGFVTWGSEGGHLWKVAADGRSPPIRLTSEAAFYVDPSWSPDGQRIVGIRATVAAARLERGIPAAAEVIWVAPTGGALTRVGPAGGARHPHFGADGSRVYLFSVGGGLVSMGWDGSDRRVVATVAGADRGPLTPPGEPADGAISPDGRSLGLLFGSRLLRFNLPTPVPGQPTVVDPAEPAAVVATDGPEAFGWMPNGTLGWVTGATLHRERADRGPAGQDSGAVVVAVPRPRPTGSVVLRGARVITMRGDEVIDDADLVIEQNRITAIGPRGTVLVPTGAKIIDVAGKTVIPGLIDIHAHWDIRDGYLEPESPPPLANLAFGVTTVRDPQATPLIFAYADLADAGEMPSPRVFSTGPGLFSTLNLQTLDDARRVILRYRDRYRTWLLKSYAVGTRRQRQLVADASAELGMMPTAEGLADTKQDLTHLMDGLSGTEHALPSVPLYRDMVQAFGQSGITYTPTLLVSFGGPLTIHKVLATERPDRNAKVRRFMPAEQIYERVGSRILWFPEDAYRARAQAMAAGTIVRAGGRVALGGHGEMQGIQNHWEMQLLAGGMTPREVLRTATLSGAEALGLEADLGSLEVGKMADLVVLDRNPLDDIANIGTIRLVMKNGVLYDGDTLDRRWPDPAPLPAPWWRPVEVSR